MKPQVVFKGIVKGAYSNYQANGLDENPVERFEGATVHDVLDGLAIDEFIFILRVNGKRIKNVPAYIKRCGLNLSDYLRNGVTV